MAGRDEERGREGERGLMAGGKLLLPSEQEAN